MILAFRHLSEKLHKRQAGLHVAFVDLEEAFHAVDRETLWKIIARFGYSEGMLRIIVNLYEDNPRGRVHRLPQLMECGKALS